MGNNASAAFPLCGITPDAELGYRPYMDSWDALRRNLTALIDAANDGLRSGPRGVLQLEAETDIGKSTLYRILDPRVKNPTQLDTLERIAAAYSLQVWQLLVPRLDPVDPPEYVGGRRMSVLRSVFSQTHTEAAAHGTEEEPKQQPRTSHARKSARNPGHRLLASGAPAGATGDGRGSGAASKQRRRAAKP